MTAYYNEFDPKAAAWLRQLIKNGNIAPGEVDERSIIDVTPADLAGFTQHHFFAGIGVWSHALRNSGWEDSRKVCTASLPCQPFSAAGNQKGKDDERHLLPHFLNLVRECNFDTIIGEQVESAIRHGWLDDLHTEMEAEGYAVGHCVLGAHSAGSFHQRQRLYWVAHTISNEKHKEQQRPAENERKRGADIFSGRGMDNSGGLGNTQHDGQLAHTFRRGTSESEAESGVLQLERPDTDIGRLGDTKKRSNLDSITGSVGSAERAQQEEARQGYGQAIGIESYFGAPTDIEWLYCRDNKYLAIKSGLKPLVNGTASGVGYSGDPSQPINADYSAEARVMRLKGYGNAIQAGTAQMFIEAFMDIYENNCLHSK